MSRKTTIISIVVAIAVFATLVFLLIIFGRPPLKIRGGGGSYVSPVDSQNEVTSARRVDEKAGEVLLGGASISKCQELTEGSEADACAWSVALTQEKVTLCDEIHDVVLQERCRGILLAQTAVDAEDSALCISIADEALRRTCLRSTINEKTPASFCEALAGEDKITCTDSLATSKVKMGDTAICETIVDQELQESCLGVARRQPPVDTDKDSLIDTDEIERYRTDPKKKDTDSDGLTDGDEVNKWKTNPTKADTDGDGFSDKTEIDGGYNPLGSGKL